VIAWRHRAAAGTIVGGIALGLRHAGGRAGDDAPMVEEAPSPADDDERVVVYFHPTVPEATLVLVRR
jgi:hypothetical protein